MAKKAKQTAIETYDGSTPLKSVMQEMFVNNILSGINQRLSYKQAYPNQKSKDSVIDTKACELVRKPQVALRLAHKRALLAEEYKIQEKELICEWLRLGYSNISDFVRCVDGEYIFKDFSEIGRDKLAAVESIQVTTTTQGSGKRAKKHQKVNFKLYSKLSALEQLGKIAGVFAGDGGDDRPAQHLVINFNDIRITGPEMPHDGRSLVDATVVPAKAAEYESLESKSV